MREKPYKAIIPETPLWKRENISDNHGHCINQIIVNDLGNEEILVVACGDGDVAAYRTRSILAAIEQDAPLGEPWFHENVGASAWGLAVHKEARLLAVSSNSHDVLVYAPAIEQCGPSRDDLDAFHRRVANPFNPDDPDGERSPNFLEVDQLSSRMQDVVVRLKGHRDNVPNIAFCNTDLDQEGRFLVSTDIENCTYFWDLFQGKRIHRFHWPMRNPGELSYLPPHLSDSNIMKPMK